VNVGISGAELAVNDWLNHKFEYTEYVLPGANIVHVNDIISMSQEFHTNCTYSYQALGHQKRPTQFIITDVHGIMDGYTFCAVLYSSK
jgi:hypothetical protein